MCEFHTKLFNRRVFVGSCGFALSSFCLPSLTLGQHQRNLRFNPLRSPRKATIDREFSQTQRALIQRALAVFYQRFLLDAITVRTWNLSYLDDHQRRNSPPRVVLPLNRIDPDYLQRAKDHPDLRWRPRFVQDERYFINDQIQNMAIICDHGTPFPAIDIDAYIAHPRGRTKDDLKYGNSLARADVGTMMITKKAFVGKFRIGINRYYLASRHNDLYTDPIFWAGVIAHELLHNLGHRHPDASDPNYRRYQINLWEYAVQTNGKHVYGQRAPAKCAVQ